MEGMVSEQNTIWQVLLAVHRAKLTGTLMLTSDNQLLQIQWQNGELTAIVWRNLKSQAALERLLQVRSGQYRFMENVMRQPPQLDLPNIRDLLVRTPGNPNSAASTGNVATLATAVVTAPVSTVIEVVRPSAIGTLEPTAAEPVSLAPVLTAVPNFDLNRQTLQKIHSVLIDEVGKRAAEVMTMAAETQGLSEQFKAGVIPRDKARAWIVQVAQIIRDPLNRTAFIRRAVEIAGL